MESCPVCKTTTDYLFYDPRQRGLLYKPPIAPGRKKAGAVEVWETCYDCWKMDDVKFFNLVDRRIGK